MQVRGIPQQQHPLLHSLAGQPGDDRQPPNRGMEMANHRDLNAMIPSHMITQSHQQIPTQNEVDHGGHVDPDEEDDDMDEADGETGRDDGQMVPSGGRSSGPNQLSLSYQGEVYVFESVPPEKVPFYNDCTDSWLYCCQAL